MKSILLSMAALMASGGFNPAMPEPIKLKNGAPDWKPEFTQEELEELRSLSKKERKRRVAELRAKYLKIKSTNF